MIPSRSRNSWFACLMAVAFVLMSVEGLRAQTTMPSTRMFGTGYIDVPATSVPDHMTFIGTFSGFNIPDADCCDPWKTDGSIFLGLFDALELGATLQAFGDSDDGGNMLGGFAKWAILNPSDGGLGLAVGASYVSSPSWDAVDPSRDYQPNRHGFPDPVFYDGSGGEEISTNFSPFVLLSTAVGGVSGGPISDSDFTFTLGWGDGIFRSGDDLVYANPAGDSEGIIGGIGWHILLSQRSMLHVMTDWNGFDWNAGAQLDFGGIRIGGFLLGLNQDDRLASFGYDDTKYGGLVSLAFCPGQGFCPPSLFDRPQPDTVRLPAPAPDTVVVTREVEPDLPTGTPTTLCLATGQEITVYVTAQGDTLVGPSRVSIRELRPGVVFAGTYAEGRTWFENDEPIVFERTEYSKVGTPTRLDCPDLMRVGEYMGVPLFARRDAERPYETLYVPVRPGWWQAYERGIRRTRG